MSSSSSPQTPLLFVSSTSELLSGEAGVDSSPPPLLPAPPSDSSPPPLLPAPPSDSSSSSGTSYSSRDVECGELASLTETDSFSVCTMKTVSVSSLLLPSPCFTLVLLLCPPLIGFVLFLFVQYFVPVLVEILMEM